MDGIFLGGDFCPDYIEKIKEYGIPTIAVGFYEMQNKVDAVVVDEYYNANQIANALINKGYDTIGFLGETNITHSGLDRYHGYLKALTENDMELYPEWVVSDRDEHGQAINDYKLPDPLPRAFMCHSDSAAFHLAQRLSAQNLRVPQDVAITSFDTSKKAKAAGCVIGVDVTGAKFAEVALERMLWRQRHPDSEHQRVIINASLVYL